jgi:hypothetical protein
MDTTQEYIEMCRKAKQFFPKELIMDLDYNTFWAQKHEGGWVIDIRGCIPKDDTPLFRQDQLQGMLDYSFDRLCQIIYIYYETSYQYKINPKSMEQLWLIIVMKEKYNKTWENGEWIDQNS